MKHGTISAYTNHGCRCDECRAANTNWKKLYECGLVEKRQRKHGTMSMYNTGCRCPQCISACRAYARARYQKLKQVA